MPTTNARPTEVGRLERALAFMRAGMAETADSATPIDSGIVVSTPSLPVVWAVNQLRVSATFTFEALVELADEQLAGFDYRHVAVEHQATGRQVQEAFRAAGWKVERDVVMVLSGPADRPADTGVDDAGEDEVAELMRRWYGDDEPNTAEIDQLVSVVQPEQTAEGIQVFALCGKKETKADTPGKKQMRDELVQQKFGAQAKRYLAEIRRAAMIEIPMDSAARSRRARPW